MSDQPTSNIIEPGKTPPFPARFLGGDSPPSTADQAKIADAAWAQAGGDMNAFELLCSDHVEGRINLLPAAAADAPATTARRSSTTVSSTGTVSGSGTAA